MKSQRTKFWLLGLLVLAALGYGMAVGQYRWFPYGLLEGAYRMIAGDPPKLEPRISVERVERPTGEPVAIEVDGGLWYEVAKPDREAGVTVLDADACHDGLNLVVSGEAPQAVLMEMDGKVVHRWARKRNEVWPEDTAASPVRSSLWWRVHALPERKLLVMFEGVGVALLDRDSQVVWKHRVRCHDDLAVDADGHVYVLASVDRQGHARLGTRDPVVEVFVVELGADGRELRRISILDSVLKSRYASLLAFGNGDPALELVEISDPLGVSSLTLLDDRTAAQAASFAAGRVLVSMRNLDAVAVLDLDQGLVTWALNGIWLRPCAPSVVDGGRLLVFDNAGTEGGYRAVEVDPVTQHITWSHAARDADASGSMPSGFGGCSRLPNGNVLIVDSAHGRAQEVTPAGRCVWEYETRRVRRAGAYRAPALFQLDRIAKTN